MACDPTVLQQVPLFALLDGDEKAVLADHVEVRQFAAKQRIYKAGEPGGRAYVITEGQVRITAIDDDDQEFDVDEPGPGGFFGFASLLAGTAHQTSAMALTPVMCIEVDRDDLSSLIRKRPDAGMDMLSVLGTHFQQAQELARTRSMRNPNEVIEKDESTADRVADAVARFGGSWRFIISFGIILVVYTAVNIFLATRAWDPYPFILLNLFLSMIAAIQAPVIMMSQNRQDAKDRLRSELDFDVNRRAESEIRGLSRKLNELGNKLEEMEDALRKPR